MVFLLGSTGLMAEDGPSELNYDPFSDHNQFENIGEDEEAHINYFRHGRFFDIGLLTSYTGFTQGYSKTRTNYFQMGIFLNYFFDLRFALYYSFSYGQNLVKYEHELDDGSETLSVQRNLTNFFHSTGFKYYINPSRIIQEVAQFNPYLLAGLNYFSVSAPLIREDDSSIQGSRRFLGGHAGLGFEIPIIKRKMFLALEASYNLYNPPDEGTDFKIEDPDTGDLISTGVINNGDTYSIKFLLGAQF